MLSASVSQLVSGNITLELEEHCVLEMSFVILEGKLDLDTRRYEFLTLISIVDFIGNNPNVASGIRLVTAMVLSKPFLFALTGVKHSKWCVQNNCHCCKRHTNSSCRD